VRLQQYFCIARCISFVRDEAPSTLTSNGTCPAVNWWWKPTTTTTPVPTTVAATEAPASGSSGDSCTDWKVNYFYQIIIIIYNKTKNTVCHKFLIILGFELGI